jgi:hypothetical protein
MSSKIEVKYVENFYLTKIKDLFRLLKFYEYKLKMRENKMTDKKLNECNENIKYYKNRIEDEIDEFEDDLYKMEILACGEGDNLIETDPDIDFQKFKLKIKEFEKMNYFDFA